MGYYPENEKEREAFAAWTNHENVFFMGINPYAMNDMKRIYVYEDGILTNPFTDLDEMFEDREVSESLKEAAFQTRLERFFNEDFFREKEVYILPAGETEPKRIKAERKNGNLTFSVEGVSPNRKKLFKNEADKGLEILRFREQIVHDLENILTRQEHDLENYHELFGIQRSHEQNENYTYTFAENLLKETNSGVSEEELKKAGIRMDDFAMMSVMGMFSTQCASGKEAEKQKAVQNASGMLADLSAQKIKNPAACAKRIHEVRNSMREALKDPKKLEDILAEGIVNYANQTYKLQMITGKGRASEADLSKLIPGLEIQRILEKNNNLMKNIRGRKDIADALLKIHAQNTAYELAVDQTKKVKELLNGNEMPPENAKMVLHDLIFEDVMLKVFSSVRNGNHPEQSNAVDRAFANPKSMKRIASAFSRSSTIAKIINLQLHAESIRNYIASDQYQTMIRNAAEALQASFGNVLKGKNLPDFDDGEEKGFVHENFSKGKAAKDKRKQREFIEEDPKEDVIVTSSGTVHRENFAKKGEVNRTSKIQSVQRNMTFEDFAEVRHKDIDDLFQDEEEEQDNDDISTFTNKEKKENIAVIREFNRHHKAEAEKSGKLSKEKKNFAPKYDLHKKLENIQEEDEESEIDEKVLSVNPKDESIPEIEDEILPENPEEKIGMEENKELPEQKELSKAIQTDLQIRRKSQTYLDYANQFINKSRELKRSFHQFSGHVHELIKIIDQYDRKDENGKEHALSKEELETIKKQFADLRTEAVDLLELSRKKGLGENTGFYRSIETFTRILSKDLKTFDLFRVNGKASLRQLMNTAQTEVVDISHASRKEMKNGVKSSRIPIAVPIEENGKTILKRGMFTAEKSNSRSRNFRDLVNEYRKKKTCRKGIEEIIGICNKYSIDMEHLFGNILEKNNDGGIRNLRYLRDYNIKEVRDWFDRYYNFHDDLTDFVNKANKQLLSDYANEIIGFQHDGNIEQRNCATSAVAKLLGIPEAAAESVPMTVWDGNKYVRGSFMEFGKGLDINNIQMDDPVLKAGDLKLAYSSLVSASNLQVLDFICGQFDHHTSNVFFQIEGQRVTGIQAIDNDSSFVDIPDEVLKGDVQGAQKYQYFIGLKNMKFVEEKTADRIRGLKPEILAGVLAHYRLSRKEINAACRRLKMLQNALDEKYLGKNLPKNTELETEHNVYVLKGNQLDKIDFASLTKDDYGKIYNQFLVLHDFTKEKLKDNSPGIATPEVQVKKSSATEPISITHYLDKMKDLIGSMQAENKGMFISSQEYRNVLAYAKIMKKELENMLNSPADNEQFRRNNLDAMFLTMNDLAAVYLDQKNQDGSLGKSETARRRVLAVQQLQDFTSNNVEKLGVSRKDHYCLMSAADRKGCYHPSHHAESIKEEIADLARRQAKNASLSSHEFSLKNSFLAITEKSWKNILENYRKEAMARIYEFKDNAQLKKDVNMARLDLLVNVGAQESLEDVQNNVEIFQSKLAEYLKNPENHLTVRERTAVYGLNKVVEKLKEKDLKPSDPKEIYAEREFAEKYKEEQIAEGEFEKNFIKYRASAEFSAMIGEKKEAEWQEKLNKDIEDKDKAMASDPERNEVQADLIV